MRILASYSNKGGVGKTAAAVNLALAAAREGRRVLLCDLDPQGAASFYFRVKPSKKLTEARFFKDVERFTGAIRASDFEGLDVLPANPEFRAFDVLLSRMKNPRSRLKKALDAVEGAYDLVLLDCPPGISTLSETVFASADRILVPVIPTTLSARSVGQLLDFFAAEKLPKKKFSAFFSMVQRSKSLHGATMEELRGAYPKRFLETAVPFSSDIERMGVHRAPVAAFAPRGVGARAFAALWNELGGRI